MTEGGRADGYGRPPKSGQFRKGQSGNPRGRPRKQADHRVESPSEFRTFDVLRSEAGRKIVITDASGRHALTTRQAVIRATMHTAMKGGPLAQRTVFQWLVAEDKRHYEKQREMYLFWEAYKEKQSARIRTDIVAGRKPPEILPHPDDVVLVPHSHAVRFVGAVSEEARAVERRTETRRDLMFELSCYFDEQIVEPCDGAPLSATGPYMIMHQLFMELLPPRLRVFDEVAQDLCRRMLTGGVKAWEKSLEERCHAAGVPFRRRDPTKKPRLIPLSDIALIRQSLQREMERQAMVFEYDWLQHDLGA